MRQRGSWLLLTVLTVAVVLQPGGCAGPLEGPDEGIDVDAALLQRALEHARDGVMVPAIDTMVVRLDALDGAVAAWASAPTDASLRGDAQEAYAEAMLQWGVLDGLQFGPAAPSLDAPGGADLRDAIYSWPTVNPCRVDQETALGGYVAPDFFEVELVNVYGLDALEHLLFAPQGNACPGQVDINAEGTWDALGAGPITEARAAYAAVVVGRLKDDVGALRDAWSGSFGEDFVAGTGVYESQQDALDDAFRGLFYIELMKSEKLAFPLGLRECGAASCPEMAESQDADLSARLLQANLEGFAALITPADGVGLADLLEDTGEGDLADTLRSAVVDAQAACAALDSVRSAVDANPESVQRAYDAIVTVADLLEGDVATVLTLTVPAEAAGDAD